MMLHTHHHLTDKRAGKSYTQARKTEQFYSSALRKIARAVGDLVDGSQPETLIDYAQLRDRLRRYSELIKPWATSVATRMVAEANQADEKAWRSRSSDMGRLIMREIETAPTGEATRRLLNEQVDLITSLPTEAAERVHKLALEAVVNSGRAKDIAAEIMRTGEVTKSRALLIARTEVSRASTTFTAVRAQHIGSQEFIWRTSEDSDVRASHRKLNGLAFRWDKPPECDPGHHALPGCIWNCRCHAEPIIAEW